MKKLVVLCIMVAVVLTLSGVAFSAEQNKAAPVAQAQQRPMPPAQRPMSMPMNKDIDFISGSITKIDASVPGNVKIEIVNDVDSKNHIVAVGPNTNILKVIDAVELKVGEKARIVAKKTDDKEVAISVVTGKLKEMRMPRPPAMQMPAPTATMTAPKPIGTKDQVKK